MGGSVMSGGKKLKMLGGILMVFTCPLFAQSQSLDKLPRFESYPVRTFFNGRKARLKINGAHRLFKTRIREGYQAAPVFAGRFIVATWGCGAPWFNGVLLDPTSGRVTDAFHAESFSPHVGFPCGPIEPMQYKLNSRLMIIYGEVKAGGIAYTGVGYFVVRNGKLTPLKIIRNETQIQRHPGCGDVNLP